MLITGSSLEVLLDPNAFAKIMKKLQKQFPTYSHSHLSFLINESLLSNFKVVIAFKNETFSPHPDTKNQFSSFDNVIESKSVLDQFFMNFPKLITKFKFLKMTAYQMNTSTAPDLQDLIKK